MIQRFPLALLLLATLAVLSAGTAQAQTRFNYQAVVRDASDHVVAEHAVALRFKLHQDSQEGPVVYQEEHLSEETTTIGLVNVRIGEGTNTSGSLDTLDWLTSQYYLQVEVDLLDQSGYMPMGTSPIVSVPIAEYAKNSGKPWTNDPNGIHYLQGNVGIGTTSVPTTALEVKSHLRILGDTIDSERIALTAANGDRDIHIGVYDHQGTRRWNFNLLDRSEGNSLSFFSDWANLHALRITPAGGVEFRATTHNKIRLYASEGTDNYISSYNSNGDQKWIINMGTSAPGTNEPFAIYSNEADDGNGQYLLYLRPDGRTQVQCLEILGGCDLNERFNSTDELEPGTVVIADPERPGQIRMANEAYDQRVIGVISGANGIKPGLTLRQEKVLDGAHPVALDGRVYVKVTGPVAVGDLLTTSGTPGTAMAAKNRKKAFGAVIGKALESDADVDGMVLMLVQPR